MVGDWVILRSNGLPTYNFAAAVDDPLMKITHVIRGEEHLPNTLRQIMIYDALGAPHPMFAHVPLILAEDRSKLSKRHGASSVGDLRTSGYLPDAALNYLLLLGWSHPQSKEIMPRDEMIKAFSIERIGKSAAVFDKKKLLWMNGQYIRKLDLDTLCKLVEPYMPEVLRVRYSDAQRREIVAILQDSIDLLSDFPKRARHLRATRSSTRRGDGRCCRAIRPSACYGHGAGSRHTAAAHTGELQGDDSRDRSGSRAQGQGPLLSDSRRDDRLGARTGPHARRRRQRTRRGDSVCWKEAIR